MLASNLIMSYFTKRKPTFESIEIIIISKWVKKEDIFFFLAARRTRIWGNYSVLRKLSGAWQ